ncbi:MAG TPA: hypothetical protein VMK65_13635, partial [Longimicrobiales bacterium]|nr:hypothetical protein [Longimicrobiales bacterium]
MAGMLHRSTDSQSIVARALLCAALLTGVSACADEEPTGPRAQRERGPMPQFVTVGAYNDFVRVQISNEPPLTQGFAQKQYQAVVPASATEIFVSRGDDWWMRINATANSASFVDG